MKLFSSIIRLETSVYLGSRSLPRFIRMNFGNRYCYNDVQYSFSSALNIMRVIFPIESRAIDH